MISKGFVTICICIYIYNYLFTHNIHFQALRDAEKATGGSRPPNEKTHVGDELSDSEDEGEELLKNVRDRKQSIAKLNISPQEKDLIHRLSSVEEGMFIKVFICSAFFIRMLFLLILIFLCPSAAPKISSGKPTSPTTKEHETWHQDIPSSKYVSIYF